MNDQRSMGDRHRAWVRRELKRFMTEGAPKTATTTSHERCCFFIGWLSSMAQLPPEQDRELFTWLMARTPEQAAVEEPR